MKNIFCFGDSNTYGFDACSFIGSRLPAAERFADILEEKYGYRVVNEGMNGRKIPQDSYTFRRFDEILSQAVPVDLVVIMLGTNDVLWGSRPDTKQICDRMKQFLLHAKEHPLIQKTGIPILLVAPPPTRLSHMGEVEHRYDKASAEFGSRYRQLAQELGLLFADAGSWEIPLAYDGVHFTGEGHGIFAEELDRLIRETIR